MLSLCSCLALPTCHPVLFPLEWVLPSLTGTAEQATRRAGLRQPVCAHRSFPRLVSSRVCVSVVARGALGWLSHLSGRRLVPQQRTWPSGQGYSPGICPQPVKSGYMRLMFVMSACLQCASCGALHAWAGLCDLLGHVLCIGAEPLLRLSPGRGVGTYPTTVSPSLRMGSSAPGWEGGS